MYWATGFTPTKQTKITMRFKKCPMLWLRVLLNFIAINKHIIQIQQVKE